MVFYHQRAGISAAITFYHKTANNVCFSILDNRALRAIIQNLTSVLLKMFNTIPHHMGDLYNREMIIIRTHRSTNNVNHVYFIKNILIYSLISIFMSILRLVHEMSCQSANFLFIFVLRHFVFHIRQRFTTSTSNRLMFVKRKQCSCLKMFYIRFRKKKIAIVKFRFSTHLFARA